MKQQPDITARTRRPKARATEIVFGALHERLEVVKLIYRDEGLTPHIERIEELLDELRRSLTTKEEIE